MAGSVQAQAPGADFEFKLSLPEHDGQFQWRAEGFRILDASAKPKGAELGFRGTDGSDRLHFLAFLFLFPELNPMTSLKCRDGIMDPLKKADPGLKVLATSRIMNAAGQTIELIAYSQGGRNPQSVVRSFVAEGDLCADVEFYSQTQISADDADIRKIISSYQFNPRYKPQVDDAFFYAEILYRRDMLADAAPIFENVAQRLKDDKSPSAEMKRRIATDQAGMAYGISGNIGKARSIFEAAIKIDPDYPLNYYNLACADAEEGKLADARTHLQQAFARKANMLPGEKIPDPTTDSSFLPHKNDKDFWAFLQTLR
jgi:tetratricopeptide (TPR) repeat protein